MRSHPGGADHVPVQRCRHLPELPVVELHVQILAPLLRTRGPLDTPFHAGIDEPVPLVHGEVVVDGFDAHGLGAEELFLLQRESGDGPAHDPRGGFGPLRILIHHGHHSHVRIFPVGQGKLRGHAVDICPGPHRGSGSLGQEGVIRGYIDELHLVVRFPHHRHPVPHEVLQPLIGVHGPVSIGDRPVFRFVEQQGVGIELPVMLEHGRGDGGHVDVIVMESVPVMPHQGELAHGDHLPVGQPWRELLPEGNVPPPGRPGHVGIPPGRYRSIRSAPDLQGYTGHSQEECHCQSHEFHTGRFTISV